MGVCPKVCVSKATVGKLVVAVMKIRSKSPRVSIVSEANTGIVLATDGSTRTETGEEGDGTEASSPPPLPCPGCRCLELANAALLELTALPMGPRDRIRGLLYVYGWIGFGG